MYIYMYMYIYIYMYMYIYVYIYVYIYIYIYIYIYSIQYIQLNISIHYDESTKVYSPRLILFYLKKNQHDRFPFLSEYMFSLMAWLHALDYRGYHRVRECDAWMHLYSV